MLAKPGRDLLAEAAVAQRPVGGLDLAALDQASISRASANRFPSRMSWVVSRSSAVARVGLRVGHGAAPEGDPAAVDDHERHAPGSRRGRARRRRMLEARVGEIERVRREQADHEQVERAGDVELLLAEQPAAARARARCAAPPRADSLARARSKARLASTRRSPRRGARSRSA